VPDEDDDTLVPRDDEAAVGDPVGPDDVALPDQAPAARLALSRPGPGPSWGQRTSPARSRVGS
jgi:hypothetical protein